MTIDQCAFSDEPNILRNTPDAVIRAKECIAQEIDTGCFLPYPLISMLRSYGYSHPGAFRKETALHMICYC